MPSNKTLNEKKKTKKKRKRQGKKRPLKGVIFSGTIYSQVMFSCLEIGRLPDMMTQIPILLTIYVLYRNIKPLSFYHVDYH